MCRLTCANCSMYVWQRSPAYLFLCVLDLPRLPSALLGQRGNSSHCNRKGHNDQIQIFIQPHQTKMGDLCLELSPIKFSNVSQECLKRFEIPNQTKKDPKTIKNMEPHPKRSSLSRQNTGKPFWSDTEDMSSQSWNWIDTPFHSLS